MSALVSVPHLWRCECGTVEIDAPVCGRCLMPFTPAEYDEHELLEELGEVHAGGAC